MFLLDKNARNRKSFSLASKREEKQNISISVATCFLNWKARELNLRNQLT